MRRIRSTGCLSLCVLPLLMMLLTLIQPTTLYAGSSFPRVTRGAYLQSGSGTNMVVRWRTALPTTSVVRYGREIDRLDHSSTAPGQSKDHIVPLINLEPGTLYYYSVGTHDRVLQGDRENRFRTSPPPGSDEPIRVWVLGDPGTDYPVQRAVRDSYLHFSGFKPTDLILTLGDNAYRRGTDFQFQKGFFEIYREIFKRTVVWPALGNHDARSADAATESGVYFDVFTLPTQGQAGGVPSGAEAYYSFDYGNVHFICLNSHDADLDTNSPMLEWLRRDLASNSRRWTIAYWHHAPYSKGSHDSDGDKKEEVRMNEIRERALPVLEGGGVELVLCGHTHLYERSFPLKGHYGKSDTLTAHMIKDRGDGRREGTGAYNMSRAGGSEAGTVYVNAGSAGHATKTCKVRGLDHRAIAVGLNVPGSLILDISKGELDVTFLDDKGRRRDWFTLIKP